MNYKGYNITEETDSFLIKEGFMFRYFKGITYDGDKITAAKTLDEAAAQIDELTCNDPSPDDKLKIAVQCIEACKNEFIYRAGRADLTRDSPSVFTHHAELCANALKAIQE